MRQQSAPSLRVSRVLALSPRFRFWWLLFCVASLADVATTWVALSLGASERNPAMAWLFLLPPHQPALALLSAVAVKLAIMGYLLLLYRYHQRAGEWVTLLASWYSWLLPFNNVVVLLIVLHRLPIMPG